MESSLYILIPLSVVLVFVIAWLFWWSVKDGQFDDMEGPAFKLMMDDDRAPARDAESAQGAGEKNSTLV
ncbi:MULTISPECIES: cbb3-type cytochrome oxidase assembly protein CcoS [Uliginosibacterium]|uniref:cbb3-type cytochrome oxidase assembly protein CcoS n=1 Tax=Uliginosibacterium TaxID=392735 RepID=UPI0020B156DF|nr:MULTISPECIES: cbb3-type cytochrome oxidase assembly protein CcoS [Uliginosibacterium]MDO6384705.1 cbb3-type cytochrome oxidase assembly protein CcoS [Uliginosibacterium sp. 31-12]